MVDNSLGGRKMYPKKIILIFVGIFVFGLFPFSNLMISPLAQKIERPLHPMASITFNQEIKVTDPEYKRVSLEQVNEIAKLESVQAVEYHLGIWLYNENLKLPHEDAKEKDRMPLTEFMMNGITHPNVALLKEEVMRVTEGRSFNEDELEKTTFEKVPVLISEEFAILNDLSLGSEFTLDNRVYLVPLTNLHKLNLQKVYVEANIAGKKTYEFEVIGIFTPNKIDDIQASVLSNNLFAPEKFVESALQFHINHVYQAHKQMYQTESWWADVETKYQFLFEYQRASNPLFVLKESADWEMFQKEANQILSPCHEIERVKSLDIYKLF